MVTILYLSWASVLLPRGSSLVSAQFLKVSQQMQFDRSHRPMWSVLASSCRMQMMLYGVFPLDSFDLKLPVLVDGAAKLIRMCPLFLRHCFDLI